MSGSNSEPSAYRVGDVFIDVGTRQVSRDGNLLQLPPLSFDLLLALVRRAPNAVSSGELMELVWTGRIVNDETIAKRVELTREALGDDSRQSRYIALVRGHGYRITADVEPGARTPPVVPGRRQHAWPIAIAVMFVMFAAAAVAIGQAC